MTRTPLPDVPVEKSVEEKAPTSPLRSPVHRFFPTGQSSDVPTQTETTAPRFKPVRLSDAQPLEEIEAVLGADVLVDQRADEGARGRQLASLRERRGPAAGRD